MRRASLVSPSCALGLLVFVGCSGAQSRGPRAPTIAGAVRFRCEPRDARVLVDEVDQGACRVWEEQYVGLGPGTHRVRIEREGFLPFEREFEARNRRETLEVRLRERPE